MIFILLTFLAALALAAVSGWFSIVGFMAIYAGAPMYALIMGVVVESAKLVTTSWLYRNSHTASWKLKLPLYYFTIALMAATSIGVFGFLSKAHLEQGASTVDNGPKIERLNYQIEREKSIIADNEKVIKQLDDTVNSFLGKDRTDKSLAVRKSQAPQRKQLREDIDAAQKRIDALSEEKLALESEVRKMQLEVGPIRYIAELVYGVQEDSGKNVEAAVRLFTLLIVSTLDPLAIALLIAANHSLANWRKKDEIKEPEPDTDMASTTMAEEILREEGPVVLHQEKNDIAEAEIETSEKKQEIHLELVPYAEEEKVIETEGHKDNEILSGSWPDYSKSSPEETNVEELLEKTGDAKTNKEIREISDTSETEEDFIEVLKPSWDLPQEEPVKPQAPWAHQDTVLRELLGQHFTPLRVNEKEKDTSQSEGQAEGRVVGSTTSPEKVQSTSPISIGQAAEKDKVEEVSAPPSLQDQDAEVLQITTVGDGSASGDKYPKALSWLNEFRRD